MSRDLMLTGRDWPASMQRPGASVRTHYTSRTARIEAEEALEVLSPVDPERAIHTRLLMALRISPEAEYRAWLDRDPTWAAALVRAGRERDRRLRMALAEWIASGMPGVSHAA